jgi:predicted nucleotidyltransferase
MESRNIPFSRTRRAILSLLFGHTDETFYLRQIVRASGYGLGPVQRELKLLTEAGIIRRAAHGRQVYFQANSDSPIFPEIKSLITKTVGVGDAIRGALASIAKDIEFALIYGSIARGDEKPRSDIDLLVVGDLTFSDVVVSLQYAQKTLGREINPTVYSGAEFRTKLRKNHHFLTSTINGPKIFLIGDKNELGRLAQKRLARRAQDKSKRDL